MAGLIQHFNADKIAHFSSTHREINSTNSLLPSGCKLSPSYHFVLPTLVANKKEIKLLSILLHIKKLRTTLDK